MSNYTEFKLLSYEKNNKKKIIDYETFFDIHYNEFMNSYKMKRKDIPDDFDFIMEIYNPENFHNVFSLNFIDTFVWLSFKKKYEIKVDHPYISHIIMVTSICHLEDNILVYAVVKRRKWCCY